MNDDVLSEDLIAFVDCTCDHDSALHGWEKCDEPECSCEGHWEE